MDNGTFAIDIVSVVVTFLLIVGLSHLGYCGSL
jgi:hypothetical protein